MTVSTVPQRVLIAGFGSIGRRHFNLVRAHLPQAKIWILRRPGSTTDATGVELVDDLDTALALDLDFAVLSGPAPFRLPLATRLVEAGVPLLLEKPLSDSHDGVAAFQTLVTARKVPVQVGYCLRFDPSLMALKAALDEGRIGCPLLASAEVGQYLPSWRPGTDYRQSVSAQKRLGGGALLELSHEIDYLLWLFGPAANLNARLAKVGSLEVDTEDFAQLDIAFKSGVIASARLDMVQRLATRHCKIVGSEGCLTWNGIARITTLFQGDDTTGAILHNEAGNTMYDTQLGHFLECLRTGQSPRVGVAEGIEVLRLVEGARRADRTGTRVVL